MKTLVVCVSVSHGNTRKIAEAIGQELAARVVEPEQIDAADLADYDLIGFGSGIFGMAFHRRLYDFVNGLPSEQGKKAFVFATRGGPQLTSFFYMSQMVRILRAKGFDVVGTFSCLGFDTWLPLRLVGGLNRGRPNDRDLDAARSFAAGLAKKHRRTRARPNR